MTILVNHFSLFYNKRNLIILSFIQCNKLVRNLPNLSLKTFCLQYFSNMCESPSVQSRSLIKIYIKHALCCIIYTDIFGEFIIQMTISADYRPAHVSYYVSIKPVLQGISPNTILKKLKLEEIPSENLIWRSLPSYRSSFNQSRAIAKFSEN